MKKTKTQAFANLIGSLIFIALGAWALTQTYSFQEVKNTYVQAAVFPQIMCVGMLIFAIILLIQSIIKLMTMDENDPLAEPAASINFIKDRGVLAALFVMLLCVLFVAFFKSLGYIDLRRGALLCHYGADRQAQLAADGSGLHPRAAGHVAGFLQGADGQHPNGTAAVPARFGRYDLRRRAYELEFTC